MHLRLLTLALVSCVLFVAAPAMAQDTGTYTTTTPTTTTPTETTPAESTAPEEDEAAVEAESDAGAVAPAGAELASTGGGNTWLLLGIGGALVAGSALVLVTSRERRSDSKR